jgi:hypothetical protein
MERPHGMGKFLRLHEEKRRSSCSSIPGKPLSDYLCLKEPQRDHKRTAHSAHRKTIKRLLLAAILRSFANAATGKTIRMNG